MKGAFPKTLTRRKAKDDVLEPPATTPPRRQGPDPTTEPWFSELVDARRLAELVAAERRRFGALLENLWEFERVAITTRAISAWIRWPSSSMRLLSSSLRAASAAWSLGQAGPVP
jgi:hypothetical protein